MLFSDKPSQWHSEWFGVSRPVARLRWNPWPMRVALSTVARPRRGMESLVGGLEHVFFFFFPIIKKGYIILPIDFHIFQRGWNHQRDHHSWVMHIKYCQLMSDILGTRDWSIGQSCLVGSQDETVLSFAAHQHILTTRVWGFAVPRLTWPCWALEIELPFKRDNTR